MFRSTLCSLYWKFCGELSFDIGNISGGNISNFKASNKSSECQSIYYILLTFNIAPPPAALLQEQFCR